YLILAFGAADLVLHFFYRWLALNGLGLLIAVVAIEAIVVIIAAMRRRVKGARVVGAGILFFALFTLFLYVLVFLSGGSVDIGDSTLSGLILFVSLIAAILSVPVSMSAYLAWNFSRVSK